MNVCCVLWCVVRSCRACEFKPQAGWLSARAGGLGAELPRSGSGFAEEEKRSGGRSKLRLAGAVMLCGAHTKKRKKRNNKGKWPFYPLGFSVSSHRYD